MNDDELIRAGHRQNARTFDYVSPLDVDLDAGDWLARNATVAIDGHEAHYVALLRDLLDADPPAAPLSTRRFRRIMRHHQQDGAAWLSKAQLVDVYRRLCEAGLLTADPAAIKRLQMKPVRSQAGVAIVTVLTKPFPCPGRCIFCPTDVRMPKSYLHDEPGAQRAERHNFDPYDQTANRLEALDRIGHPTDKIELIILGGTWSSYRRDYQEWFIRRCFDALNGGAPSVTLAEAHARNVSAQHRNVGLVVETRQDHIDADELRWLRALGVTKVQVGIQSMDDRVLALNDRGHNAQATRDAFRLLRLAGFKIQGHWMCNLLGGTPTDDVADYARLWSDPAIQPDELKIYPCMLLANSDLYAYWQRGEYVPYDEETVIDILMQAMRLTPRTCRLTRVVRDIPTDNVVAGFRKANLRQIAEQRLTAAGTPCQCIRCREIRRDALDPAALTLYSERYATDATDELFLSYATDDDRLAGFLRLSLPNADAALPLPELAGHAMIREVHVYGPLVPIGESGDGEAQHSGLGAQLIDHAKAIARAAGFSRIAVISAIGTQGYYARHGFRVDGHYMTATLTE